ncbi:MAG: mechanosensitive ion channel family protein [Candidatus Borkfalkiaceae bacterium]|nr:mechanosensitive ion channel family protein [Clostridia bacterium]MDY6222704.1 mechanosensitive ion channel family protein [Christensenellaceae bacterium]
MSKINKKRLIYTVRVALAVVYLIAYVVLVIVRFSNPQSAFATEFFDKYIRIVKQTVTEGGEVVEISPSMPQIALNSLINILLILSVAKILRTLFRLRFKKSDRTKTVVSLLDGFVKYGAAIAVIIYVLKACGVNTEALIASIGILALIIGLGAQSLIADIIAGMFIIFENEFNTGEIISIDGFRGEVIEIGIRTTKLLDAAGNIKIMNHSDIKNVVNLSREPSLAAVDVDFPYDVPIEYIEKLFDEKFAGLKDKIPGIISGPFYKGVSEYKDSNVTVKIVATCKEQDRFQVQRDLLREYRAIITAEGIDISYPHVVIGQEEKSNIKVTGKDIKAAIQFVEEQKELSKNLEDKHN